jgi:ketosteroid isomerase-like protein
MASSERQGQNVELARRGIEAFGRSDMETVLEVLAEDVTVFSSPDLMNAGTYQATTGSSTGRGSGPTPGRAWPSTWSRSSRRREP